ncbi:hypothetical protein [Bacillus sp. JJ1764]|uniref:hypothetical protein n=1 Tax=Bacillus sp. JJ1764 TaxID=3122964 RepID=UPI002FFF2A45
MKNHLENKQLFKKSKKVHQATPYTNTKKLVMGSVLAAITTLFQAAGVFTGIGFAFSILATLPIVLSAMLSLRIGFMSYFITILLLVIMQPSELFVFPFTTGLLGIALGAAFKFYHHWLLITFFGGAALSIGILFLLYVLKFPVLGPDVSYTIDLKIVVIILICSIIYSFVWTGLSKRVFKLIFPMEKK